MIDRDLAARAALIVGLAAHGAPVRGQDDTASALRLARAVQLLHQNGVDPTARGVLDYLHNLQPSPMTRLSIERLVDELGAERFPARVAAERRLRTFGVSAQDALAAASRSDDLEVRVRAQRILAGIRQAEHAALLDAAFAVLRQRRPDGAVAAVLGAVPFCTTPQLQRAAVATLTAVATRDDMSELEQALTSANPVVRMIAVDVVAALAVVGAVDKAATIETFDPAGDPFEVLRPLLRDRDDRVRIAAARALADRGDRASLPALITLLKSAEIEVRTGAIVILSELTGRHFGYAAYDTPDRRAQAVGRFEGWLSAEGATAKLSFPLTGASELREVDGFLVSSSGSGLFEYDRRGRERWRFRCQPYDAQLTADRRILLTERSAGRVRLIDRAGRTLWQAAGLREPTDAELLPNGNVLVLEHGASRAVELDGRGARVWSIGGLSTPFDVDRLPNGNTLVADSGNNRLVELDRAGRVVWEKRDLAFPNGVARLPDGSTLYTTYTSGTLVMLDPAGDEVWSRTVAGATLYPPAAARDRIYVSDGKRRQVLVLDLRGRELERIQLPTSFADVWFVRGP